MLSLFEANNAEEWDYKGEGAANVIVLYCGTLPNFVGKVLRVKKAPQKFLKDNHLRNKAPVLSVEEQSIWSDWQEVVAANSKEILAQAYVQHAIGPLLGSEYLFVFRRGSLKLWNKRSLINVLHGGLKLPRLIFKVTLHLLCQTIHCFYEVLMTPLHVSQ